MRAAFLLVSAVALLAPAQATAFSTVGQQRAIVLLVEHRSPFCPAAAPPCPDTSTLGPPRRTAAQWERLLNTQADGAFVRASWRRTNWRFRVVANPARPSGWWPAPRTVQAYAGARSLFARGGIVDDAGTTLINQAIQARAVTPEEVAAADRFLVIDNWHRRGGQEAGTVLTFGPLPRTRRMWVTTAAVAAEDRTDEAALSTIVHELGHQLGLPDLYATPCDIDGDGQLDPCGCPLVEPGGLLTPSLGIDADCVGRLETMGVDTPGRGWGSYSRMLAGWVGAASPQVRTESARDFSGAVRLWPIARPGHPQVPSVLRLSPLTGADVGGLRVLDRVLALIGRRAPYTGYQADCRRREEDDRLLWQEGVMLSWIRDGARKPQHVVRTSGTEHIEAGLITVGETYSNTTTGLRLTLRGFAKDGSCLVDVNYTPPIVRDLAAPISSLALRAREAPQLQGLRDSHVLYLAGLGLGAGSPYEPRPPRAGVPTKLRVPVINQGTAASARGAVRVRVSQPYAVASPCDPPVATGTVVATRPIPKLAPGAAVVRSVPWTPRRSGSTGVDVVLPAKGDAFAGNNAVESAFAFTSHPARLGRRPMRATITVRARTASSCHESSTFTAQPLAAPAGWRVALRGDAVRVKPGESRTLSLRVTPPAGARSRTVVIPVAIVAGGTGVQGPGADLAGAPEVVGGLDVVARVWRRERRAPVFRIPREALHLPRNDERG